MRLFSRILVAAFISFLAGVLTYENVAIPLVETMWPRANSIKHSDGNVAAILLLLGNMPISVAVALGLKGRYAFAAAGLAALPGLLYLLQIGRGDPALFSAAALCSGLVGSIAGWATQLIFFKNRASPRHKSPDGRVEYHESPLFYLAVLIMAVAFGGLAMIPLLGAGSTLLALDILIRLSVRKAVPLRHRRWLVFALQGLVILMAMLLWRQAQQP